MKKYEFTTITISKKKSISGYQKDLKTRTHEITFYFSNLTAGKISINEIACYSIVNHKDFTCRSIFKMEEMEIQGGYNCLMTIISEYLKGGYEVTQVIKSHI